MTHPLKPALSCRNWLKSAMSLSIASRMCMCRSSVQTVSVSDRVAVLSSTPVCAWNLYLNAATKKSQQLCSLFHVRAWTAYMYVVPSWMGSRSLAIAWYVNSCSNGATVSIALSVMISVPRGRGGSEGLGKSGFAFLYSSRFCWTMNASTFET